MKPVGATLLSMEGVSLAFKEKQVLKNLSFSVERGEIFGFLGPSGAGKTTTIKLLTRQLIKDRGRIELFCRPIESATDDDYERIGILSDTSNLYDRMTIEENLRFYAHIRGVSDGRASDLLKRVKLFDDRTTLLKKCSKGMRQRAALAAALVHEPELLFLDEPTSGLDPVARAEIHVMLKELQESGTTIFLTTHDMVEAEKLCTRVGILNEGSLIACDNPKKLMHEFAQNTVAILTHDYEVIKTTKDSAGAEVIAGLLNSGACLTIHSEEPNLEEVFLQLTGKEF